MKSNFQDFQSIRRHRPRNRGRRGRDHAGSHRGRSGRLVNDEQKAAYEARGKKLAAAHHADFERARDRRDVRWDASPISTARLCMELYAQIKDDDWSLASPTAR